MAFSSTMNFRIQNKRCSDAVSLRTATHARVSSARCKSEMSNAICLIRSYAVPCESEWENRSFVSAAEVCVLMEGPNVPSISHCMWMCCIKRFELLSYAPEQGKGPVVKPSVRFSHGCIWATPLINRLVFCCATFLVAALSRGSVVWYLLWRMIGTRKNTWSLTHRHRSKNDDGRHSRRMVYILSL